MVSINLRFLFKALATVVVLVLVVFAAHAWQARRIPNALKQQIELATAEGNGDLAIRHLRQYLEFRPDDLEARADLAAKLKARGSLAELSYLYDHILRGDPNLVDIRRDAIELALKQHRYTDAADHATKLLEKQPNDGIAWRQLADANAALHRNDDAAKAYEKAVALLKDDPSAYREYITWLWTEANRQNEAIAIVDRFVNAFPDKADPYLLRSRIRMSENEIARPDVRSDLETALKNQPDSADALVLMADWLQRAGETSVARERLIDGVARHPADVRFPRRLAWLDLHRGNPIEALRTLETGLNTVKVGYEDLLVPLGDLLIQLGERKRAEAIVAQLEGKKAKSAAVQAKYLSARLAMKAGDWAKAISLLSDLRTDTVEMPGLTQQANLLLAIGHRQTANVAAEREALMLVLNRDPKHIAARVALAQSFLTAGDLVSAIREFDEAGKSPYVSSSTAAMSIKLRAIRLEMQPSTTAAEWAELDRMVAALVQRFPKDSAESILLFAELMSRRGEMAKAVALLRQDVGKRPGDQRLWAALAEHTANAFGVSAALTVCEEGITVAGDGPDLRLAKARLYARDPLQAYSLESLDKQIDSWTDGDQTRLITGLIDAADRAGQTNLVVRWTHRLAARRAGDALAWLAVAEQAHKAQDEKTFTFAYGQIVRIEGETGPNAAVAASMKNPVAQTLIDRFGSEPNRADVCLLLAKSMPNDPRAKTLLSRGLVLDPTNFEVVMQSIRWLASRKQKNELSSLLTRLKLDPRWNGDSLRRAWHRAIDEALVNDVTIAVVDLIRDRSAESERWYADWLAATKQRQNSVVVAQAITKRPGASIDDDMRAMMFQPEATATIFADAKARHNPRVYTTLLAHWANSGRPLPPNAISDRFVFLQASVQDLTARGQAHEAVRQLKNIDANALPTSEKLWVVKSRCVLLAAHGNDTDRKAAANELIQNSSHFTSADDQRTLAATMVGLQRYLDGDLRIQLLNQAATLLKSSTTPRDRFLVFQIERAKGDTVSRNTARTILNELLQADANNLDYLLAGLEELTEANATNLAGPFVQSLTAQHGQNFRTIAALARYECAAGHAEKVVPLVETWIRALEKQTFQATARTLKGADLLDECARRPDVKSTPHATAIVNAAVARYATLLPNRLEALPAAASLLAAFGRHDDAVKFTNQYETVVPTRTRAAAGVAIVRSGNAPDAVKATVRQWLDTALADDPFSTSVLLNDGEFFVHIGDRGRAEQVFRRVLELDPQNSFAMNNLAWMLAAIPEKTGTAMSLIDQATRESGLTPELLDTRARIHLAAKRHDLAESDLLSALQQQKTPLRYFHLAMAKRAANQNDEAKKLFQTAVEKGLDAGMIHPADLQQYQMWMKNGVQ